MPPRKAAVLLERHLPHSASLQCEHPAALGTPLLTKRPGTSPRPPCPPLPCWVVPPSKAGSREQVPPARFYCLHSKVRLRLVYTWPLFLQALQGSGFALPTPTSHTSAPLPCAAATVVCLPPPCKAFRASRTRPSRPLAQHMSVSPVLEVGPGLQRLPGNYQGFPRPCPPQSRACQPHPARLRPHQRRSVLLLFDGRCLFAFTLVPRANVRTALTPLGRPGPGRGGRLPTRAAGLRRRPGA